MSSNPAHHVSHPHYTREQLHGQPLAVCKQGEPTRCTINAGPARAEDGKYVLTLEFGLSLAPDMPGGGAALGKAPLDQATVEKIEAVEQNSPLWRMRFVFALMQDVLSASLAKDDTPKTKLNTPPAIPLGQAVTFDPAKPPNPIAPQ